MAGVVGAEALHKARLARIAVLAEPCVPAAARCVGGGQQLFVMRHLKQLPCGCGDGDDHLDLSIAAVGANLVGELDGGGELAVRLLLGEEGHMVGARGLERRGLRRGGVATYFCSVP